MPEEETRVKTQIEESEATINRELQEQEFEAKVSDTTEVVVAKPHIHPTDCSEEKKVTVGDTANEPGHIDSSTRTDANVEALSKTNEGGDLIENGASKDAIDDGGDDVVEGEEDTVIY